MTYWGYSNSLENSDHYRTLILSYAANYASSLYCISRCRRIKRGFERQKSYQMDPANRSEAMREIQTDIDEGADWVMVKPGHTYLDIIRECKSRFEVPTFAYHVGGEYAMGLALRLALDRHASLKEILLSSSCRRRWDPYLCGI